MHLFTYGTLMFPEIWDGVVGTRFETRPGALRGFAVYRVVDGVYPVMVAANAASRIDGVVYLDVDEQSLAKLDAYESKLYDRCDVQVTVGEGEILICQAYQLPDSRREFASSEPWDREWFRREAMGEYLLRMNG